LSLPGEIDVRELQRMRAAQRDFVLLDVREDDELRIARLDWATHIPMAGVPERLEELTPDRDIVVMCHSGVRSAHVAAYLRARGFVSVANLAGGIDAWSSGVDPAVPVY